MPIRYTTHVIFAATLLIFNFLNRLKGKNMEQTLAPEHVCHVAPALGILFILFITLISLIVTVLLTWAYCKIFSKAGYCWALGLLMLVPIANIVMPFILGFGDWPIQKELRLLKQQQEKPKT